EPSDEGSVADVVRFVRDHEIALVNLHIAVTVKCQVPYYTRLLGALRADGRKIVATLHGVCPDVGSPAAWADLRQLYSLAHAWVVGNETEKKHLLDHTKGTCRPIVIARHGPYTLLDGCRFTRSSARRLLGLPAAGRVVLYFGMLRPEKGLEC